MIPDSRKNYAPALTGHWSLSDSIMKIISDYTSTNSQPTLIFQPKYEMASNRLKNQFLFAYSGTES